MQVTVPHCRGHNGKREQPPHLPHLQVPKVLLILISQSTHNWESWSIIALIILFPFFAFSCLPHPWALERKAPRSFHSSGLKTVSVGADFCSTGCCHQWPIHQHQHQPGFVFCPLNKLMADSVLLQKYCELNKAQREQAAGLKHLVEIGELVNKRGWRLDQKGMTYNGTWAKKGCAPSCRSKMTKHCGPGAVTFCTVGRDPGARRNAKLAAQYIGNVQRKKKTIKGQILGCLKQAETTDLHEQSRINA